MNATPFSLSVPPAGVVSSLLMSETGKLDPDVVRDFPVGARLTYNRASWRGKKAHCNVVRHFIDSTAKKHYVELHWNTGEKNNWSAGGVVADLQTETMEF